MAEIDLPGEREKIWHRIARCRQSLGSCQDRSGLAAMIEALSLHPSLNTPVEAKRLEAARAAMANWKAYSVACRARHNAPRLRLNHR